MNPAREAPLLVHPRYEAGPVLGRGGQGVVLRVHDREAPERALVAKIWLAGAFEASALAAEFALLRRLDIRGLVRAHDFGRDERTRAPFLVEDFVEGAPAQAFVDAIPERRVARLSYVVGEVAATLGALHDAAFVHGDLKPQHVRVTADERVVVLDLGSALARSPTTFTDQAVALTTAFAAPEVRGGARPSRASDLYSLGALAWALATGSPHVAPQTLQRVAHWVPPSLADLIDHLLAQHPRDRPENAERVLEELGLAALPTARRAPPPPTGRATELASLLEPQAGVRYVLGPSGSGKTHLLREVVTRALLSGRVARRVAFPHPNSAFVAQLVSFFRGTEAAWPFTTRGSATQPMLVTLDGLQEAPVELITALDAFRCRGSVDLDLIVAAREAPPGARALRLEALDAAAFGELCRALGVTDSGEVAEYARMTGRNPGWLVAARGRVPLSHDMVLERVRSVSAGASQLLAGLALLGGVASERLMRSLSANPEREVSSQLAELLAAALVVRRATGEGATYALQDLALAPEIAAALGSFEIVERIGALLMEDDSAPARGLITLANAPFSPNNRDGLLDSAAWRARQAGTRSDEADALFALAAAKSQRTNDRLLRLERLTRHAGGNHPEVIAWLVEAAERNASLVPLVARRQAEQAVRAGDFALAEAHVARAEGAAQDLGDRVGAALSLATRGAVALYRADVPEAERALRSALAQIAVLDVTVDDPEEVARVEHNSGVVALYGDRVADAALAFERSLAIKRKLGDRAGVRSCLLNLGLALARSGDYARAQSVLEEAVLLAVSLGQHAGRAWCLAARADLEIRRGAARAADRFIAEAEAVAEAPPMVRADLALLKGQSALLDGDAARALGALSELDPALRGSDPLLDTRAILIWGAAQLASIPAAPRAAARSAIRAARMARSARLLELEAQALALLRRTRKRLNSVSKASYDHDMPDRDAPLWSWLNAVAAGIPREEAIFRLLRQLREASGAERVLLATSDALGHPRQAWAVDLDGFALDSALSRFDLELVQRTADTNATLYQRDIDTVGGRGSRLAIASPASSALPPNPRALLLLEHRFKVGAFDGVSAEDVARFATLAGLATRLEPLEPAYGAEEAPERDTSATFESERLALETGQTTALPTSGPRRDFRPIIGESRALRVALAKLETAVDSDLPVLILGETGTGKELFARALHEHGARARAPFVALNCAAIPDLLFESELFGHARGAFTGAERARTGLIARAEGGVLFLDEMAELPLARQAALLRVLESRQYRPVGSDEERPFDVRIIAASNRPLDAEVALGKFRQDLLFRINVLELRVPALRERAEDIPVLVRAFLNRANAQVAIAPDAMSALESYPWPGNVRELEHQIQRLLALGVPRIERAHLPRGLRPPGPRRTQVNAAPRAVVPLDLRAEVERALSLAEGNITHAAQALGLTRHGLKKRMLRLGLRAPQKLGGGG